MIRQERLVTLRNGQIQTRVEIRGEGPPLLFLHAETGHWDPFLERLSRRFTVYAPDFPGTSPGDEAAINALHDLWDLTLYFEELLDALQLASVALVGHSVGGMFAAELAAQCRQRIGRLVLIAPAGLWRDDQPIPNWWAIPSEELPARMLAHPDGLVGKIMFSPPQDREQALQAVIRQTWAKACVGKFTWPIPDKGLHRRIHRISAPTLVVWGSQDRLIPPLYAREFVDRIADASSLLVEDAGHIPQLEQLETVSDAVMRFLA
ncbi:alpha/beta fold hydrolase [Xanthomonas maliensis]|uniref:alpha/beta fold hydrolase n=1 Tax=Xanthomonas maliensis TaxID=1321368 RepID=UPI0003A94848|nr:alpha/beta hydrolase [Xanthomonas maliensis]KAB7766676.1 alpha/beta hydrolase [Xanthomonas maliensis]